MSTLLTGTRFILQHNLTYSKYVDRYSSKLHVFILEMYTQRIHIPAASLMRPYAKYTRFPVSVKRTKFVKSSLTYCIFDPFSVTDMISERVASCVHTFVLPLSF